MARYSLEYIHYEGGSEDTTTITVGLKGPKVKQSPEAATGKGFVETVCKVMEKALGFSRPLENFKVSWEMRRQAFEVVVSLWRDEGSVSDIGMAVSPDVFTASVCAYINALNAPLNSNTREELEWKLRD